MVKFSHTMTFEFFSSPLLFRLAFNFYSMTSCSCSPFSLSSNPFCSISTNLRALTQFFCSRSVCLQQGRRSRFNFCSRFRQKLLCKHRLTFRSRSSRKTSFFSPSVILGIPAIRLTDVVTAFLCVRNALI